jgi:hypothetical protein
MDVYPVEGMELDIEGEIIDTYEINSDRLRLLVRKEPEGGEGEVEEKDEEEYTESTPDTSPSGLPKSQEMVLREDLNDLSYRSLQEVAKENDIKANQTTETLIDEIVATEAE